MPAPHIHIVGARQNNLKNIDLALPLNRLIAVTGVSGSGKSSLAVDTLYAEGQRRYVETFSPYARQFMDRMDKPRVSRIDNIPPAIAIDRKDPVRTSRSTVGTMAEITDYVKLLFPRFATLHCPGCDMPVFPETPAVAWQWMSDLPEEAPVVITFPIAGDPFERQRRLGELGLTGFDRIWHEGRVVPTQALPISTSTDPVHVLVDRIRFSSGRRQRIMDSLEQAFAHGEGHVTVFADGRQRSFSRTFGCAHCGDVYAPPTANLFSFNSPVGACESCRGFGRKIDIDLELIIPDRKKSIDQGAIKPWGGKKEKRFEFRDLASFCRRQGIDTTVAFRDLPEQHRSAIIDGAEGYYGIRGFFEWLEGRTYKMHVRVFLSRYRSYDVCPACRGTRFKPEALLYRLNNKTVSDIYGMNVDAALEFFTGCNAVSADTAGRMVVGEIVGRLRYLSDVGVGYLTLDRQSRTLSGGEVQRVALASSLGASLVNTLYILDEPSIGLHPRDSRRLVGILHKLRDLSNTVVVVEHDPDIIRQCDILVDMGPGAGEQGGEVMYFGPVDDATDSPTGRFLKGKDKIPVPCQRRTAVPDDGIRIIGARENNLKNIDVAIPLGCLVCLTGVSGSGKSTLAEDILYRAAKRQGGQDDGKPGAFGRISGVDGIGDVILVDQRALGRTPRANLLTYTGALGPIRKRFADTPEARKARLGPGHFSFNVNGGRCDTCKGEGYVLVEMQFLSDVLTACPDCRGKRFKDKVLAVSYRGKNIADILSLTVSEAVGFFCDTPAVQKALAPVMEVGLGYMRLGQPLSTLSGGEAQRLKLSRFLRQSRVRNLLFIFDEPTTGLHLSDIRLLLNALNRLVDQGHSVLVIEHNMDVIKTADWVIDLGPEGGREGGYLVACGPPEVVATHGASHTGSILKAYLGPGNGPGVEASPAPTARAVPAGTPVIAVKGAREHNLDNISLSIPRDRIVVVTGLSGSGKSTLAFDILFAEGRRRYLESLTPYARQFVGVMERPDVDVVTGLPPTVAIEQRISHAGRRSTVATLTETYHFLRLLFARVGRPHCPGCGRMVERQSRKALISLIQREFDGTEAMLLSPRIQGRKGYHRELLEKARKAGYLQARIDGEIQDLVPGLSLSRYHEHSIALVEGVLPHGDADALISDALVAGDGSLSVVDMQTGTETLFSIHGNCPVCGIGVEPPDPRLFSFNSRQGKCPTCDGIGRIPTDDHSQAPVCKVCQGSRLRKEALGVRVNGKSIWDLVRMPAAGLSRCLADLQFPPHQAAVAEPILSELLLRLSYLCALGLDYLTLDRSGETLSGGEGQRVRLAAQLGTNLTGVLYVLDEPTIGLHPRDNHLLLKSLQQLRDRGNTVLVVEHDEETIRHADTVIEMGPGGGRKGGKILVMGTPQEVRRSKRSVTAPWVWNAPSPPPSRNRPVENVPGITVTGARANNLKNISAFFPLGCLIAVTGVSGSGKSTLVKETLYAGVRDRLQDAPIVSGTAVIKGWRQVQRTLEVDHSPIGKTPRSVPASYIGILGDIRQLFARLPEARARGYAPGRFSFNVEGGRCAACKGQGTPKVVMSFLPDVYVACDVCGGTRYNAQTLDVRYRGKTISDVLEMTFGEAAAFFAPVPSIARALKLVCDIGLDYLHLGQPSPTLSGGEAQRIKLAEQLVKISGGHCLYVLDEPTTGLHPQDVVRLLGVLQKLVDQGHTIIGIEHNLAFMHAADYLMDLGPEGGAAGGQVVAAGAPRRLIQSAVASWTLTHLRRFAPTGQGVSP